MATSASRIQLPASYRVSPLSVLGVIFVVLVVVWLGVNLVKEPAEFYRLFLIGLTNGAVYGLVALGYSLVYGILELINFAHGDVFMLGAMLIATLTTSWGLAGESGFVLWGAIFLMLVIAMAFCATINTTIELVAYRRLRGAPRLAPLITAIGMSFILQNVGLVWLQIWKGDVRPASVPDILPSGDVFTISGVPYTWRQLIVLLFTVPVLTLLIFLVQRTKQGKAMRATAQDRDASAMMGINVDRTISFTFAIGGALAGAGGVIYALSVGTTNFQLGFRLGLFAFTAAVLGGIGNLNGAVLGGLLIGLVQAYNDGFGDARWTTTIIFSILILILVFRPSGLLGEQTPEGQ